MDRILKIAIYIAVLFFASIWISSVIKSCNSSPDITYETTEGSLDEFEEDFFEDNLGEDEEEYESDMGGGSDEDEYEDEDDEYEEDYDEIDEALEENDEEEYKKPVYRKPAKTNSQGKYMVLAGSYLIKGNASTMVGKLNKLGYGGAEVVVFNMSQYHSVCAARHYDYNEALQMSRELKRRGVDNYVHTRQ